MEGKIMMFSFLKAIIMTDLMRSLKIMAQGMVGIFIVMLIIYFVIILLNKFSSDKKESK